MVFFVVVLALAIQVAIAVKFEMISEAKGYEGYFWWCLLFGPAGWLMVVALPDRNAPRVSETSPRQAFISSETDDKLPEL